MRYISCRLLSLLVLVAFVATLSSCSITKYIPTGQYLLSKSKVVVDKEPGLHKDEMIAAGELDKFVRQHPNNRLLGTNIPLWIYAQANPNRNTWWNRLKKNVGAEPVILDSAMIESSISGMDIYMDGMGFFRSGTSFKVDTTDKKAQITYFAKQGEPYRIDEIKYDFKDAFIEPMIMEDSSASLLKKGAIFNVNILDQERARITAYLKNRGYYNFSINNISYSADTTVGRNKVNLTMIVKQYMAGYNAEGESILDNNQIYRIRDIYIFPNYNPTVAATDSLYTSRLDTINYNGLNIVYDTRLSVRSEILRRTINLYPNYLYNANEVKRTYDNIMRLGYYKSASILFTPIEDSTTNNLVTFIGGDASIDSNAEINYTKESYLNCNILCTPALKQSMSAEIEGTTTSDYFGVLGKLGYQNRNIFRGVELFEISVRGGYEFMRSSEKRNSFEIGGSTSFSFPRFITPWRVDRYNQAFNPRTKIEISQNTQRRPYYHRSISSIVWGYSWGNRKNSSYTLRPIDVSIVKLRQVDQDFLDSLDNPYLRNSYKSQFIAGLSGSYRFDNKLKDNSRNSWSLQVNFETNGNLINAISRIVDSKHQDYYDLFGIRYAQYFRVDANMVRRWALSDKSALVYRLYAGWGLAYGNSTSIPFDKLFYSGGSNSMRGWMARTLGPGSSPKPSGLRFPSQLGNFKLETNLEGRFPVWGMLHGALFFDLGNIWFARQGSNNPQSVFHFNSFFEQLGFNTGVGARFDLGFFVFRLDWGIQLHNPNNMLGDRWIKSFNINNTTLNFGVGYPF